MTLGLGRVLFGGWAVGAVVCGSVFTSFHQPFRAPQAAILTLTRDANPGRWRAVHFVSSSCGCSQKVLEGLRQRGPLADLSEQIVVIHSHDTPLPGSEQLLASLAEQGFSVQHIDSGAIPAGVGLRGVPMLAVASPEGKLLYTGGYGPAGGNDPTLIRTAQMGHASAPKPILGCAVGEQIRRAADPFRWKY